MISVVEILFCVFWRNKLSLDTVNYKVKYIAIGFSDLIGKAMSPNETGEAMKLT